MKVRLEDNLTCSLERSTLNLHDIKSNHIISQNTMLEGCKIDASFEEKMTRMKDFFNLVVKLSWLRFTPISMISNKLQNNTTLVSI